MTSAQPNRLQRKHFKGKSGEILGKFYVQLPGICSDVGSLSKGGGGANWTGGDFT